MVLLSQRSLSKWYYLFIFENQGVHASLSTWLIPGACANLPIQSGPFVLRLESDFKEEEVALEIGKWPLKRIDSSIFLM